MYESNRPGPAVILMQKNEVVRILIRVRDHVAKSGPSGPWIMTTTDHYSTQDLSEAQSFTLVVTRMPSLVCLAYADDSGNSHQRGNTFTRRHSNKTVSRSQHGSGKDCLLYQSLKSPPPWKRPGFHTNSSCIWPHFKATNWKQSHR